jgi:hypothetical protein
MRPPWPGASQVQVHPTPPLLGRAIAAFVETTAAKAKRTQTFRDVLSSDPGFMTHPFIFVVGRQTSRCRCKNRPFRTQLSCSREFNLTTYLPASGLHQAQPEGRGLYPLPTFALLGGSKTTVTCRFPQAGHMRRDSSRERGKLGPRVATSVSRSSCLR